MSSALTEPSKFKSWYRKNDIAIAPWLFLLPAVLFFATYVIVPIGQSFWISFHMWDGLGEKTFVGMDNYERLLGLGDQKMDRKFETSFWNNIKWLLLYLLAIPMGLFIALFLNQTVTGIRLYKSLFFFPFVISQVVVGLVFSWFYLPNDGLFDVMMSWFGVDIRGGVLGNPKTATYGIIAAGLWPQTAYCMILYLTGLNSVDPEQVGEAVGHQAEVTGHTLGPARLKCLIASPTNIDAIHGAGHHIKPGGENDGVELYFSVTDDYAVTRKVIDRLFMEIDQLHIGLIESLEIIGLRRQAPCQDGVVGAELFGNGGVIDPLPNFGAREISQRLVGLHF